MPRRSWGVTAIDPEVAEAHATVVAIEPANGAVVEDPPTTVIVVFNEAIGLAGDDSVVLDGTGASVSTEVRVVDNEVQYDLPADLADGTYVIVWGIISADSHRVGGGSTFHVGAPSASAVEIPDGRAPAGSQPVDNALVAVLLGSALVGVGASWFAGRWRRAVDRSIYRVVVSSLAVAGVAVAARIPVKAVLLDGGWSALGDAAAFRRVLEGPTGVASLLLIAGLLIVGTAARRQTGRMSSYIGTAAVVAGLVAEGHTRSADPSWLVVSGDVVHVVGGALWFGGVAALVVSRNGFADTAARRRAVLDVSAHAIWAVVAVVAGGVAMALAIVPEAGALVSTRWGVVLIVKIVLVGALVAVGWFNRWRVIPRLADEHQKGEADSAAVTVATGRGTDHLLRRTLRIEVALFAAVAIATGVLVGSSPQTAVETTAPTGVPGPSGLHETVALSSDAGSVRFDLTPGLTGYNDLYLAIVDPTGEPLIPPYLPTVELSAPALGVARIDATVHDIGGGNYHVPLDIPILGTWEVTVDVRTGTFETGDATVTAEIGG